MGVKKKKSKKQIQEEMERQQEELRKQQELEKKRQEEEETRRQEQERIQKELEAKLKAEEDARLAEESVGLRPYLDQLQLDLNHILEEIHSKEDLEKYLHCSSMPDPSQEKDMTAYIALMSEKKYVIMEETLRKCQESELIIREINYALGDALETNTEQKRLWCMNYVQNLRNLARRKIQEITAHTMQHCDEHLLRMPDPVALGATKIMKASSNEPIKVPDVYLQGLKEDVKLGIWINHENLGYKTKPMDFSELGLQAELPKTYIDDPVVMRVIWTSYNSISGDLDGPDLVIGGVYEAALFNFPRMPKKVKKWLMRPLSSDEELLAPKPYPPSEGQNDTSKPLHMVYVLPPYIYSPPDTPKKICWWDENQSAWTNRDVEIESIDQERKIVKFLIKKLAPMALLISRTTEYPYVSWYIRCINSDKSAVALDIEGKRMAFKFIVTPGRMEFVDKRGLPELAHLRGKQLPPGVLLLELSKCGIHLLPEFRDYADAGLTPKQKEAEERANVDIAMTITTCAFRSCKWNKAVGADMVCARLRENLEFDEFFAEDEEIDWRSLGWHANKVSFVNIKESAAAPDSRIPEGHATHVILELALRGHITAQAEDSLQQPKQLHLLETVKRVLRLFHLLSFS